MEINNKFNVGDKVYAITLQRHFWRVRETDDICPVCNNTNKIHVNGYKFTCPNCNRNRYGYTKDPLEIIQINVEIDDDGEFISYMLDYNDYDLENEVYPERNCFSTQEEAIAECKKRNAEILTYRKEKK